MKFVIIGKNIDVTPGLKASVEDKIGKLSKYFDEDKLPIIREDDFKTAILKAFALAQPGDLVALSPACSSFDKFKNFAERGNTFRTIVEALEE